MRLLLWVLLTAVALLPAQDRIRPIADHHQHLYSPVYFGSRLSAFGSRLSALGSPPGRQLNLRGIDAKVIEGGRIRVGDIPRKI